MQFLNRWLGGQQGGGHEPRIPLPPRPPPLRRGDVPRRPTIESPPRTHQPPPPKDWRRQVEAARASRAAEAKMAARRAEARARGAAARRRREPARPKAPSTIVCEVCGLETPRRSSNQTTCPGPCRLARNRQRWEAANAARKARQGPIEPRDCVHCDTRFQPESRRRRLCSSACQEARKAEQETVNAALKRLQKAPEPRPCLWRLLPFTPAHGGAGVCSTTCAKARANYRARERRKGRFASG